ncbi:MAG: SDR family oxidoreductase [Sphingobacteriales bacterium]|jgi:dTDP-4-dehydrorhamnose reductase
MQLLITGIHGLVGQYLIRILEQWPGQVIVTGRGPCRIPDIWMQNIDYEQMDITDPENIHDVFERVRPDAVIHAAAEAQPDTCELYRQEADLVNTKATGFLLEAAKKHGSFFTYVSTDFVFPGTGGPYSENDETGPVNYYGLTKLRSEQLVREYPHGWAIVRAALVYGNTLLGTRTNIISWVLGELQKGKSIRVVGDQVRTPTFAGDLAAALLLITKDKHQGIWHISGNDVLSPHDIALMVASRMNLDASLITKVDASTFSQPAVRPLRTPFDISKARAFLRYEPINFKDGMEIILSNWQFAIGK